MDFWYGSSAMPKPGCRSTLSPDSRSSSAQKAWIVPRFTRSTRSPSSRCRRSAISPAALLVKVKTQILDGSTARCSVRNRTRSIRQKVLPAPGPARTSSGCGAASIASRCEADGMGETQAASGATDAASAMNAVSVSAETSARMAVTVRDRWCDRRTVRERSCRP
jgi:hypothetical protein